MTTRNVGLAAVIGVLVAAGSLVVAPVAQADIDFECKPGCWGAAAASPSAGQETMRLNYRTRQGAEDAAVLWGDGLDKARRTQPPCGATSSARRTTARCSHRDWAVSRSR